MPWSDPVEDVGAGRGERISAELFGAVDSEWSRVDLAPGRRVQACGVAKAGVAEKVCSRSLPCLLDCRRLSVSVTSSLVLPAQVYTQQILGNDNQKISGSLLPAQNPQLRTPVL